MDEFRVFEKNHSALIDWPYAINAIEETLDLELLQGRAIELLFRSLNAESLVAFVGTGVSAAYGRMSWPQLLEKQLGEISEIAKQFRKTAEASIKLIEKSDALIEAERPGTGPLKPPLPTLQSHLKIKADEIRYRLAEVSRLYQNFNSLKDSKGVLGGDIYPIQFQIAKRLQDALQNSEHLFIRRPEGLASTRGGELDIDWEEHHLACKYGYLADGENGNAYILEDELESLHPESSPEEEYKEFKLQFQEYHRLLRRRGSNLKFKDYSKQLVYDECAHAEHILTVALRYSAECGRGDWLGIESTDSRKLNWNYVKDTFPPLAPNELTRDIRGLSQDPERYKVLGFYKKESVSALTNYMTESEGGGTTTEWKELLGILDDFGSQTKERGNRVVWTPTRRFVVGMILSKLKDPFDPDNRIAWKEDPGGAGHKFFHSISRSDYHSRRALIHGDMDPLEQLSMDLGIRKYLTTNYDLEVERMMADRGYEVSRYANQNRDIADQITRSDQLGGQSSDTTFRRHHTADLLSFTLDLEAMDSRVFHLHGRATSDSDIVITERDYMNLYLRNDEQRELVNEAIDLAFSANPILFLGIGMTEDDVLRPLRQFVSDQEKRRDRVSIALLPGGKGDDQKRSEASVLFTRFGVLPLYFGKAHIKPEGCEAVEVEWLRTFSNVTKSLGKVNTAQLEALRRIQKIVKNPSDAKADLENLASETEKYRLATSLLKDCEFISQTLSDPATDKTENLNAWLSKNDSDVLNEIAKPEKTYFDGASGLFGDTGACVVFCDKYRRPKRRFSDNSGYKQKELLEVDFELKLLRSFEKIVRTRTKTLDLNCEKIKQAVEKNGNITKAIEDLYGALESFKDEDNLNYLIRDCIAIQTGLEGITQSIYTIMLCAELRYLHLRWKHWWAEWQEEPKERKARFLSLEINPDGEYPKLKRFARHKIANGYTTISDKPVAPSDIEEAERSARDAEQECAYTGVRAVDTFLASLDADTVKREITSDPGGTKFGPVLKEDKGRRTFLIAAHRGLGKGIFLSALESNAGLHTFIQKSWSEEFRPTYLSAVFINYSFSTEIASTWDMVNQVMFDAIVRAMKPDIDGTHDYRLEINKLKSEAGNLSRLELLRWLLFKWQSVAGENKYRILFCFNSIDVLLEQNGQPKNDQIKKTFEILSARQFANLPIDIIMITDEENTPQNLRSEDQPAVFNLLLRPGISTFGKAQMHRRLRDSGLLAVSNVDLAGERIGVIENPSSGLYLHFCRVMKAEHFLIDNFPILASHLLVGHHLKSIQPEDSDEYQNILQPFLAANDETQPKPDDPEFASNDRLETLKSRIVDTFSSFFPSHHWENVTNPQVKFRHLLLQHYGENESALTVDLVADSDASNDWARLRRALQFNRFSFTLVLAAADYLTRHCTSVLEAKQRVDRFMNSVIDQINTASNERREEIVVSLVLDIYERYHRSGSPTRDINLHMAILRHLAVIGQPVSCDVLVRVPEIRRWFKQNASARLKIAQGDPKFDRRTEELRQAIEHLERRGLLFRLNAQPTISKNYKLVDGEHDADGKFISEETSETRDRFSVHRLVHRHVMRKMGGSLKEFIYANNFAATVHGSMPRELPRPNTEAYRFMRELVADLSEYADRHALSKAGEPWHMGTANAPTRIEGLRAALGILRSTFSVAVVSRFEDYKLRGLSGIQHAGCFEEHRIQLRWLLRKAFTLDREYPDEENKQHIRPFYRDEIIWLYNECGVVCLVQGNLVDAQTFLRQALKLNRTIEGRGEGGDQHCRIGLNLAMVQIERGRLDSATRRLDDIIHHSSSDSIVHSLALGQKALIYHMRGQLGLAFSNYEAALKHLRQMEDSRGISIICRHLGDLKRRQGDLAQANSYLSEALASAELGGHEDLYHRIRLARIRVKIATGDSKPIDHVDHLQQIERYAEIMDMPSLLCETLHIRAEFLLSQGETEVAGKLLKEVIAKAKRNQLNLRLASATTLYGKVMFQRKQFETGKRLLRAALEMVKQYDFQLEIERVEGALEAQI